MAMRRPLVRLVIGVVLSLGLVAQSSLGTFSGQPDGTTGRARR